MVDAVIVSTARTPIGKAVRGAFNLTHGADMGGHVIAQAVKRAGIEPGDVEDVVMGCANPEGATGGNIARQCAIRAGLPVTAAAQTVNRFCSSGLQAIALAAYGIKEQGVPVAVAGGLEFDQPRTDEHEHQVLPRRLDRGAQARPLPADDRDRRHRRQALRHQSPKPRRVLADEPAAHGSGPEDRTLRCRDRAHDHGHGRSRTRRPRRSPSAPSRSSATRATGLTRTWRGSPSSSLCAATTSSSPPATPASSPTAPRPAC